MKKMSGLFILAALCLMMAPVSTQAGGSVSFSVSYSNGDYYPSYFNGVYDYYDSYRTGYVIVEPLVRSYSTWYPNYGPDIVSYRSYPRRVTYYCDGPYVYSPIYSRVIIFDQQYRPVYRYSWDYLGYGYTHSYIGTSFNFSYSSPSYYADPWRYKPWYNSYSHNDHYKNFGHAYNSRQPKWYDRTYKESKDERRRSKEIDDRFDDRKDRLQLDRQRLDNNNRYDVKSNDRTSFSEPSRDFESRSSNASPSRSILDRSTLSREDTTKTNIRSTTSSDAERMRSLNERSSRLRSLQERSADVRSQSTPSSKDRNSSVKAPSSSSSRSSAPAVKAPSSRPSAPAVKAPSSSSRSSEPSVNRSSSSDSSRSRSDSAVSRTRNVERSRSR